MTEAEDQSQPEDNERLFTNGDRPIIRQPERHGCVTTWLVFMLVLGLICIVLYFFVAANFLRVPKISSLTAGMFIIMGFLNVVFSIKLLKWKKIGFYGFLITDIIGCLINLTIGLPPILCYLGMLGTVILYGILKIKNKGRTAWEQLN